MILCERIVQIGAFCVILLVTWRWFEGNTFALAQLSLRRGGWDLAIQIQVYSRWSQNWLRTFSLALVSVLVGVIHSFAGFPLVLCQVVHLLHVNVSKRIGSKRMLKNISEIWTSNSLFLGVPCLWMLLVSRSEKCRNNVIPHFFTLTSPLVTFQKSKDMPKTSALLFEGSWRIHVMIDAPLDEAKIWKKLSWDQKHAWMRIGWMGQPWGYCSCFSFLDTWLFVIVLYLFEYLCK